MRFGNNGTVIYTTLMKSFRQRSVSAEMLSVHWIAVPIQKHRYEILSRNDLSYCLIIDSEMVQSVRGLAEKIHKSSPVEEMVELEK